MSLTSQNNKLWGDDIPWLAGLREKAARFFEHTGLPTAKTEAWKYSYFAEADLREPQLDDATHECECHCHNCHHNELPFDCYEIKLCNGKLESEEFALPRGVSVKSLAEAIFDNEVKPYLNKSFDYEKFLFAALNTAYLEQGFVLLVERNTVLEKPIYVHYHQHGGENRLCNIRNIVIMENQAQASIVEHFAADNDGEYFDNIVNELYLSAGAKLQHYKWQNEAESAHHIALNSVQIKSNAEYTSFCAQGSCVLARNESYIRLLQEGAKAEVNGIYRIREKAVCDITTNIRHLAAHTVSNQLVKGVVDEAARGVFQAGVGDFCRRC